MGVLGGHTLVAVICRKAKPAWCLCSAFLTLTPHFRHPSRYNRFLLRACVHDVKITSSNKATLKIPILPIGSGPPAEDRNVPSPPTPTAVEPSTGHGSSASNASSETENDAGEGEDSPGEEQKQDSGGEAGGESEGEEATGSDAANANGAGPVSGAAAAAAVPQAWSEGRTTWKGDTLKALRTPLFVVEITVVGDKGSEMFAYTQRLAAVKESALALIDKAIASTQVRR